MDDQALHSPEKPLITTATILILSGFLFGMAVAVPMGDMASDVASCGVAGLLAYIAFEFASTRRETRVADQERRSREERLQRHVDSVAPVMGADLDEHVRLLQWLERETKSLSQ